MPASALTLRAFLAEGVIPPFTTIMALVVLVCKRESTIVRIVETPTF
jgi:hypothetical protein